MAEEEKNQEELAKEWEEALKAQQEEAAESAPEDEEGASDSSGESQEDLAAAWAAALEAQQGGSEPQPEGESTSGVNSESEVEKCDQKFELLKDIPLEISVEVGSTKLPLEEIIKLHANSVVELDRFIDEPVDIKINGKLVAKGKLYTVKDSYGVEIIQIITPEERFKLLEE
ncbi:flagellar motor switch protein FliN [Thermovibrio ammonificans]|uniref:flagellar motor switch protein FliN n=1 Tax=Thermovibrio ammonificans TaxID=228745 RepID=UPI00059C2510|nr:flagellar motor switch protein FliN [Thermovibrio ammonificans]